MRYTVTTQRTFVIFYMSWRAGADDRGFPGATDTGFSNTVPSWELERKEHPEFYIAQDHLSGYCISNGELCAVWSRVKGRGKELVQDAVWRGAESLNCFDGYLTQLYASCGFVEQARIANWTKGGPDVVVMALPGCEYAWEAA